VDVQPNPPQRLVQLPSWLLNQAAMQADRLVSEALGSAGMRKHHFSVLHALREQGSISQADLGRRLAIDRSDLHAVLNDLETAGLVARTPDASDRRRNSVDITAAGSRTLRTLDRRITAAQDALLQPLPPAERRAFIRSLVTLVDSSRRTSER
jgi:DNA-binding MarR family transcriptional regulator